MATPEARFVHAAGEIKFTAGAALASGQIIQHTDGRAVVVAGAGAGFASGDLATAYTRGVFEVPKTTGAWEIGDPVDWDDTNGYVVARGSGDWPIGEVYEAAASGDALVKVEWGLGVVASGSLTDRRTQTAKTGSVTLTIAELLTKIIDGTPTGAATYALPTAALLVAGITDCEVGDAFEFVINNKSAGDNTITVAAGSGGTADGTLTVAQHVVRKFVVFVTNVTASSEAYLVYGIG